MQMILQKMSKSKLILIGNIGKPRGLRGEFFLNSFCSPSENILIYINHMMIDDKKVKFEYIKKSNSKLLAKLQDIDNIEEIKKLTNKKLNISIKNLPKLSSSEIYLHDLVGMEVIGTNKDEVLGEVKELNNFGANDYLIIKPTNSSIDDEERLIPFIKEIFINSIDKEKKIINVNWQSDY